MDIYKIIMATVELLAPRDELLFQIPAARIFAILIQLKS